MSRNRSLSRLPQHRRLLDGWRRAQKHALTPGQFLILADLVEHAAEDPPESIRQRGKRLGMSHCAIQMAQQTFHDRGLVQLIDTGAKVFVPHLNRFYPVIVAQPTDLAFQVFNPFYKSCLARYAKSASSHTPSSTTATNATRWFAPTTPS